MNRRVNYHAAIVIAAWLGCAAPLQAACLYPHKPTVPNGSTASPEEMLAAEQSVKQYSADIETYLRCVDVATPKEVDVTADMSDAQKQALAKQIELSAEKKAAAVSDQTEVAARFNEELHILKERLGK